MELATLLFTNQDFSSLLNINKFIGDLCINMIAKSEVYKTNLEQSKFIIKKMIYINSCTFVIYFNIQTSRNYNESFFV